MRIMVVRPGPNFSVEDVARGWAQAFADQGHDVYEFAMGEFLDLYSNAKIWHEGNEEWVHICSEELAGDFTLTHLMAACYRYWPDLVFIVSGFYMPNRIVEVIRKRNMKTVLLCTESPYEEDRQLALAQSGYLDAVLLNDPQNIELYAGAAPIVEYQPHCYDPDKHCPGPGRDDWRGDVCWVGTPYPSRMQFMERVDWSGLHLRLAGNWTEFENSDHPFAQHVVHDLQDCFPNEETVDLYRSCKATFNNYRKEAHHPDLVEGWALGPREVEATATGILCAREPRGEGDELLPMLPTFTSPEELGEVLRWYCNNTAAREAAVSGAYEAIADRTFENSAARLLTALDAVPVAR